MKRFKIAILVLIMSLFITGCGTSKQTITVNFDTDSGSEIKAQTIEKGNVIEEPKEPVREGYTFEGWYLSEDSTDEFDFSTKLDKDTTLYAKWSMNVSNDSDKDNDKKVELSVSKSSVKLEVGKSTTIKATTNSNKKVTWKTSDETIATVKSGKITGVKVGNAVVTVTVEGKSKTIKVTVVKKSETTTTKTTTTKKVETTTKKVETTAPTTTQDADKTKLSNALASIKAKTIEKAGVSLNYKFDGCTITNLSDSSSDSKTIVADSKVTNLYRGTAKETITSEYKVICGKATETKTVKHVVPASTYTYTASYNNVLYIIKVAGAKNFTLNNVLEDIDGEVQYPKHRDGFVYTMVFDNDKNTSYAVRPA